MDELDASLNQVEQTPIAEEILADTSYDFISIEQPTVVEIALKKREEELNAKDADELQKISELRQQAKSDLDNWYNERQRRLDSKLETMRKNDEEFHSKANELSSKRSCDWLKVLSLIDLPDGKIMTRTKRDLTRMKECLFNAKRFQEKTTIIKEI